MPVTATVEWAAWAEWTCNCRYVSAHARHGCSYGNLSVAPTCSGTSEVRQNPASAGFFFRYNAPAMPYDVLILSVLRGLVEVAVLMLLGRGLLWLFGPKARQGNVIYDILTIGTMPFIRLARKMSPRFVPDAYVPAIAFLLLFCLWIGLGIGKAALCASRGLQCTP